jgi:hypothetical protein
VASRTITSPLDVVKILAQVGTKETRQGFLRSFVNIYRREGELYQFIITSIFFHLRSFEVSDE